MDAAPKDGTPILAWVRARDGDDYHWMIVDWDVELGYWGTTYPGSGWRDEWFPVLWKPLPKASA